MTREVSIEKAFQEVGLGHAQFVLLLICGLGFCADAAELGYISYAVKALEKDWSLTPGEIVFLEQAVFVGQMLGPVVWGQMADRCGRRPALLLSSTVVMAFGFLTAAVQNFWQLVLVRGGVGFGIAGLFLCADIVGEMVPEQSAGRMMTTLNYFWPFGSMYTLFCTWLTLETFGWRALTLCAALPTSIALLLGFFFLPESPRWLMEKNRHTDAVDTLKRMARWNGVTVTFDEIRPLAHTEELGLMALVQRGQQRRSFVLLSIIWFCMALGYFSILLCSVDILRDSSEEALHDGLSLDYAALGLSVGSELISVTLSLKMLDTIGRVPTQAAMYILGGFCALLVGFRQLPYGILAVAAVMCRCAVFCASSATWAHTPELFKTDVRGTAHALCNMTAKLGSLTAPFVVSQYFSAAAGGAIMAVSLAVASCSALMLPETMKRKAKVLLTFDPTEYAALQVS